MALEPLREIGEEPGAALLESVDRNTAQALKLASLATIGNSDDPVLVVTLADQTDAGKCIGTIDPRYFCLTEVETLIGNLSKAQQKRGWTRKLSFSERVAEIERQDLKPAERDAPVKKHGDKTMDYNECIR